MQNESALRAREAGAKERWRERAGEHITENVP